MGKSRRGSKEFSREQALIYENKKLKKMISSLRKQLARIDLDRYEHVRDALEEHYSQEEERENAGAVLDRLKNQWRCHSCNDGVLEIILYDRAGNTWYFRKCNKCEKRTPSKQYDSSVSGIIKKVNDSE